VLIYRFDVKEIESIYQDVVINRFDPKEIEC